MNYLKPIVKQLTKEHIPGDSDEEILSSLENLGIPKKEVIKKLESYYGVTYIDLDKTHIDPALKNLFDPRVFDVANALPFFYDEKNRLVRIALTDLGNQYLKENINALCQKKNIRTEFYFAFLHEVKKKISQVKVMDEGGAVEWVDQVIRRGIELGASDIHIEPQERGLQVRYRVDGLLSVRESYDFPDDLIQSIMVRLKVLANLNIAEKRRPQDGRIDNFEHAGKKYDLRVSTVSTLYGEKTVMRIFDKYSRVLSLTELGFFPEDEKQIKDVLKSSYGIIYLAGATGSGKTTTLYAMIDYINSAEINIYTIEDPVEKALKNINQIQINPQGGVTYASTLRALLRQDPDIIVVGEIRDKETAELSVQSSLTGHLVLATIHANNALDTIDRLYDMGIEPYLIGASALGFISQRLVRTLCPACREKSRPDLVEEDWLRHIEQKYNLKPYQGEVFHPKGCPMCHNIGYRGRTAVTELFLLDNDEKKRLITKKNTQNLLDEAIKQGFVPMELNAYRKVISGTTNVREILRVL